MKRAKETIPFFRSVMKVRSVMCVSKC